MPVGDHPVEQVRGHPAVAVPGGGARVTPAQAVHVGECRQHLPVPGLLFGVRSEDFAQGADLLEGTGAGEGVGRVRARVQSGVARQIVQRCPGGLGGEQPPPARPVGAFAEDRADVAVPVLRGARLGRRRVHRAPGPVGDVLRDRQPRDLRLLSGLTGEQHQRPVLVPFLCPGLEDLAELYAADFDGGVRGVVRAEGDGTGCAVADEVVGAPVGSGAGERGRRAGEDGSGSGRGLGGSGGRGFGRSGAHSAETVLAEQRLTARAACRAVLGRALRDGHRLHGHARLRSGRGLRHEAPEFAEGHRLPVERGDGGPGGGGRRRAGVAVGAAARGNGGDRGVARVHDAVPPRLQVHVGGGLALRRARPSGVQRAVADQGVDHLRYGVAALEQAVHVVRHDRAQALLQEEFRQQDLHVGPEVAVLERVDDVQRPDGADDGGELGRVVGVGVGHPGVVLLEQRVDEAGGRVLAVIGRQRGVVVHEPGQDGDRPWLGQGRGPVAAGRVVDQQLPADALVEDVVGERLAPQRELRGAAAGPADRPAEVAGGQPVHRPVRGRVHGRGDGGGVAEELRVRRHHALLEAR
ncbi:hypothetical protein P376_5939 [Streptomyces sp. HCCB10043]|nr:hypothetical protein P376_5939 [Streptomyces sp. HCCB10043]